MKTNYYYSFDCRITIGRETDSAQTIENIIRENLFKQKPPIEDRFGVLDNLRDIDPPAYIQNPIRTYLENEIEYFLKYHIDLSEFKLVGYETNSGSLNIYFEIGFVTIGIFESVVGTIDFLSKHLAFNFERLSNRFVKIEMRSNFTKIKIGLRGNRKKFKFRTKVMKILALFSLVILCLTASTYIVLESRSTDKGEQRRQIMETFKEYEAQKAMSRDSTPVVMK